MLKKRLVASLTIKNGIVVQSLGFNKYLPVGSASVAAEALNRWGIDEIILLDIDATSQGKKPNFDLVTAVSKKIFVPLTVGGGIKNLDDVKKLVHGGADKISINQAALTRPEIIKELAAVFGSQCVVVSMDIKAKDGHYEVYAAGGKNPTGLDPLAWAKRAEALGAGEILLNSIDRDGSKIGYDLKLIKMLTDVLSIPVIACGGAGQPQHFLEVFNYCHAAAAAAGNFFHFTEHSPIIVKSFLIKNGVDVRLDTYANYPNVDFDETGRLAKRPDEYLEKIRFEYQPEEII
ncbi:MAG: imidazole glycerol phosphate synthase cyclase subunit [Patescibacteria group bacterium]|nr:imidazole glycerol phosphate synthase cyclase subunit [Patescibacteria group bacterium]